MTKGLDEILSGEPEQSEETRTETAATETAEKSTDKPEAAPEGGEDKGQPRDENGKFAPKEQPPEAENPAEEEKPKGQVPQQALHAERQKARAEKERADDLERQLAELRGQVSVLTQQRQQHEPNKEPERPKEIWDDPDGYVASRLTPLQRQLAERTFTMSMELATVRHGEETVQAAQEALKQAIQGGQENGQAWVDRLSNSPNPVGDVVNWHKNSPATREADLRARIEAELREKIAAESQQTTPAAPPSVMPSDLAGARNVGSRSGPAWSGPAPLNDIFDRRKG